MAQDDDYDHLVGVHASVRRDVTPLDTAAAMASGDVPVLATPRLIAWLEAATVEALAGLPDGTTSVGTKVAVEHLRASPVGMPVECSAVVASVSGSSITLEVTARQHGDASPDVLATGSIVRSVVDRGRFLARAASS